MTLTVPFLIIAVILFVITVKMTIATIRQIPKSNNKPKEK